MRLVIDTNILIAGLLRDSTTRRLLLLPAAEFLVPEHALEEIRSHKPMLLRRSGLTEPAFDALFAGILERVSITPEADIQNRAEADRIMAGIDPEDAVFIALALSVPNDGIWSDDAHFQKQTAVKAWRTKDFLAKLGFI